MTKENASTKRTEDAPPLAFLTWRAWESMVQMVESILGQKGSEIVAKVKADTLRQYGEDAWEEIERYRGVNLDVMYNGEVRA